MEEKIRMKSLYIPAEIMEHMQEGKITMQEALTLSIIDFLDSRGECYASNEFIGNSLGLKKRRTTEIITNLENKGYISRTVIYKNGTNEVDKRILKPKIKTTKIELPSAEKCMGVVQDYAPPSAEKCDIEKSREKSKNNNIYSISDLAFTKIFDLWNSKNIIKHKKVTDSMVRAYKKALKTYTDNEIVEAIENYNKCLNDDNFYYSHKFTLENFLKQSNGMSKFTSEGEIFANYTPSNDIELNNNGYEIVEVEFIYKGIKTKANRHNKILNSIDKLPQCKYIELNGYTYEIDNYSEIVRQMRSNEYKNKCTDKEVTREVKELKVIFKKDNKKAPTGAGTQNKNNNVNSSICKQVNKYTQEVFVGGWGVNTDTNYKTGRKMV